MPIYEYRCNDCRKRVTIFQRTFSQQITPVCDRCHGTNLERLFSRFAVAKSADAGLDDFESSLGGLDESALEDPRTAAKWLRKMQGQLGEDAGPEFDEALDQMEAGEFPDDGEGDGDTFSDDDEA